MEIATRLDFLRTVSLYVLLVLSSRGRFRCNCCVSWISEDELVVIATRLEILSKVSL